MSFLAHLLKTPDRYAGVFQARQTQKGQLPLASKKNNSTSLELKTTSPA